ncbi:hypothetical protein BD410DRAFT_857870, partial [Rickenella mellea]
FGVEERSFAKQGYKGVHAETSGGNKRRAKDERICFHSSFVGLRNDVGYERAGNRTTCNPQLWSSRIFANLTPSSVSISSASASALSTTTCSSFISCSSPTPAAAAAASASAASTSASASASASSASTSTSYREERLTLCAVRTSLNDAVTDNVRSRSGEDWERQRQSKKCSSNLHDKTESIDFADWSLCSIIATFILDDVLAFGQTWFRAQILSSTIQPR